jgi:hypothetical protein
MIIKFISHKDFVSFLKMNKVYKEFRRGFSTPCKDEFKRDYFQNPSRKSFSQKHMRTNLEYWYFLGDAFEWNDTKEGWDFWYNVRDAWCKY